jgi:hypothetical protein
MLMLRRYRTASQRSSALDAIIQQVSSLEELQDIVNQAEDPQFLADEGAVQFLSAAYGELPR